MYGSNIRCSQIKQSEHTTIYGINVGNIDNTTTSMAAGKHSTGSKVPTP